VGPRAGLDAVKRKMFSPAGNRTQAIQQVARRYTDSNNNNNNPD
jgi:hypothetical protein